MEPASRTLIQLPFVSKEIAELAEQKGFDEPSGGDYWAFGDPEAKPEFYVATASPSPGELADEYEQNLYHVLRVPYQAHLQMWLRVRHNIHVQLTPGLTCECVVTLLHPAHKLLAGCYASYEQALENGLRESLECIRFVARNAEETHRFHTLSELHNFLEGRSLKKFVHYEALCKAVDGPAAFEDFTLTTLLLPFRSRV